MKLYQGTSYGSMAPVKELPFQLEKEIQQLIEANVGVFFGLELVKSELTIQQFRFDTLCYDPEKAAFVIIEYKKSQNYSVIDQGYSYLAAMLKSKADFILEYNETLKRNLKREEVDWTQSRVIFISPTFSTYQKAAIEFKNLPFELWEITRYKDLTIGLNKLQTASKADFTEVAGVPFGGKDDEIAVVKEVRQYDEDHHFGQRRDDEVYGLYQQLRDRIMALGTDVELRFGKQTIGFRANRVFADVVPQAKRLGVVLNLRKGELSNAEGWAEDISAKGHWGSGDYRIWVNKEEDVDKAILLVRKAYLSQVK